MGNRVQIIKIRKDFIVVSINGQNHCMHDFGNRNGTHAIKRATLHIGDRTEIEPEEFRRIARIHKLKIMYTGSK